MRSLRAVLHSPAVGEGAVFGQDDHAVADHAVGGFFALLDAAVVGDLGLLADAAVLVHDRAVDQRLVADAHQRAAFAPVAAHRRLRLVLVRAHDDGVADGHAPADAAADADHAVLDHRARAH